MKINAGKMKIKSEEQMENQKCKHYKARLFLL